MFAADIAALGAVVDRHLGSIDPHFAAVEETLGHHHSVLVRVEQALEAHEKSLAGVRQSVDEVAIRWQLLDSKVDLAQRQSFARYHEGMASLREEISELLARLAELPSQAEVAEIARNVASPREEISELLARLAELPSQAEVAEIARNVALELASDMGRSVGDALREVARLESDLREAESRARRALVGVRSRLGQYDLLLDAVRRNLPEPAPPEQLATSSPDALGVLYEALEESFRGSREEIVERVRPYLDDVLSCEPSGPVLDVGCGRGELLEVLASAGVEAYGVDTNPVVVNKVRAQGLDARFEDARAHLASLAPESLRALTALHLVEHLDTSYLLLMLDEAFQALRHGGLLILETPNPENVIVASSTFHLDPTHRAPLPPALLAFLVESRGFSDVEIRYPVRKGWEPLSVPAGEEAGGRALLTLVETINQHLFAPPDYSVLGRRL
jgi:O-antigen chain-terminating methyltransferase